MKINVTPFVAFEPYQIQPASLNEMSNNFSYLYKVLKATVLYDGFLPLTQYRLKHQLFAGGWSPEIIRECQERHAAVIAVLPYDPYRDQVILIEQFRIGALRQHQHNPWLLEVIAGLAESGEAPDDVARRESREEAGCEISLLEKISDYFSTPGACSEKVTLYCGYTDSSHAGGIHGLKSEDEDIRVHVISREKAMDLCKQGIINTAPAIIALQWLSLNYQSLRTTWNNRI